MKFNVNDKVRVRLTDRGKAVLLVEARPLPKEVDGWSEWLLWHLMAVFGKYTGMGHPPCFETTIELEVADEKERRLVTATQRVVHMINTALDNITPKACDQPKVVPTLKATAITVGKDGLCKCNCAEQCLLGRVGTALRCADYELEAAGVLVYKEWQSCGS